jgi:hypothetical protein
VSTSAHVRWASGGEASLLSLAGDFAVFRSTVSSPPGSRLSGHAPLESIAVRLKVHSCQRDDGGEFILRGRLLDLTREMRQCLASTTNEKAINSVDPSGREA